MNAISMPVYLMRFSGFRMTSNPRGAAVWALVVALCGAGSAHADRSDRAQPLNFAADSARVDDNQHVNILSGNVEITKGTIVLRAAKVEVRQGGGGSQIAVASGGPGGRAYFRQHREGLDEYIEGEAERVEYDGRAELVRFVGRAVMRRLNGATVADEVVGQSIIYDNKTEVFQVVGGQGPATSSGGGRVRGVISPRKEPLSGGSKSGSAGGLDDSARLAPSSTLSRPELEGAR
jgi:lipopolysaccharide export system protein LptA